MKYFFDLNTERFVVGAADASPVVPLTLTRDASSGEVSVELVFCAGGRETGNTNVSDMRLTVKHPSGLVILAVENWVYNRLTRVWRGDVQTTPALYDQSLDVVGGFVAAVTDFTFRDSRGEREIFGIATAVSAEVIPGVGLSVESQSQLDNAVLKTANTNIVDLATQFRSLQVINAPTQPTDVARLIDIQTATLPRITFDVICPAGAGVDRINDYYFTAAQLAPLGIVSGVNSYVLVEVIALTPYVGALKRHTQIAKYSEGGMACDPNPAVQTAGVTDGNISAFYDFVSCWQTGFTAPENDSPAASRVKVSIRNKVRDNNPAWPLKIRFTKIA